MDKVVNRHEGLRLRAAKLAAAAEALKRQSAVSPASGAAPFSLAFLTDARRAPHPLLVARALPRGAAVILRDYRLTGRAGLAAQLRAVCAPRGVRLIIGADAALAGAVGADGVHWPRWHAPAAPAPEGMIVTASCHNAEELARAHAMGAALALLSPAFATESHPGVEALGAERFCALAAASPLPVLALGGVDENNAGRLAGRNVAGLAAISAFLA